MRGNWQGDPFSGDPLNLETGKFYSEEHPRLARWERVQAFWAKHRWWTILSVTLCALYLYAAVPWVRGNWELLPIGIGGAYLVVVAGAWVREIVLAIRKGIRRLTG
jgi:hypothetical protein